MPLSELLVFALALAAGLALFLKRLFDRRRLAAKLAERYPGAQVFPVRFVDHAVLVSGGNLRQVAARGMLIVRGGTVELVGKMPGSGVETVRRYGERPAVALIPKSATAIGIPDLIRIHSGDQVQYVYSEMRASARDAGTTAAIFDRLAQLGPSERLLAAEPALLKMLLPGVFALLLAALGVLVYASLHVGRDFGVQLMSVGPAGHVLAATDRELIRIAVDESVQEVIPLRAMALALNNMTDLLLLDERYALIGNFSDRSIHECDLDARICARLAAFEMRERRFERAFKFALAPDGRTIIASDTGAHRLLQVDRYDGSIFVESRHEVCFPNTVRIREDGRLFVADTNHHRILEWPDWQSWLDAQPQAHAMVARMPSLSHCSRDVKTGDAFLDRALQFTESGETRAFDIARFGRSWPVDFAFGPDGMPWVLLGGDNVRFGDVLVLDARWRPQSRIPLAGDSDPAQIVPDASGMLVVDSSDDVLRRFDARGDYLGEFSIAGVGEIVRARWLERERHEAVRFQAMVVVLGLIVILVLIGRWSTRRRLREIASFGSAHA